jgi:hypothetical protein
MHSLDPFVIFTPEGGDRCGPHEYLPIYAGGYVDTEEGKAGVRCGID